ncbi:MAG: hypothetical protein IT204_05265 [Fimbriimonadaceae bacterium]|nr:hypothetical protein [Fimbriimonadaceae bacterium]
MPAVRRRAHHLRGPLLWLLFGLPAGWAQAPAPLPAGPGGREAEMTQATEPAVTYEAHGAVGDGVADDLPAIVAAHAYANEHRLPVKSNPQATYHLGRRALTAILATDTDWSTSRFTIDDTAVEDHRKSLFAVRSLLLPVKLALERLTRDQRQVDARPPSDCWVRVETSQKRLYIRRGLNQNSGTPQRDCFILRRDGSIEGDIDWDYPQITKVDARPLDEQTLTVRGGIFTTTANCMKQETGYNYWARNISISRSNTVIDGLQHRIVGETEVGHPYSGFLTVSGCANVTIQHCFVSGHRTYSTIGSAGKPVSMGTYDLSANEVVNFTLRSVTMDDICDGRKWGVIGTNFCKNILLEDCVLSRMDTHQGVSGQYTMRRCTLGYAGLNAIGRGTLLVEDSTLNGRSLIGLRGDYGSTWEGSVVIRNCRWVPGCGAKVVPYLIAGNNDGAHDFGYPCFMPREVRIDGLQIDDRQHPDGYGGPYLFTDPDGNGDATTGRFPYRFTEQVTLRNVTVASGLALQLSPDARLNAAVKVSRTD